MPGLGDFRDEHQTESIECRVRPNPLLARKDTKKEEERLRYQWDENKNLEKRDDKFNILVTLFRAGSQKGAKRKNGILLLFLGFA